MLNGTGIEEAQLEEHQSTRSSRKLKTRSRKKTAQQTPEMSTLQRSGRVRSKHFFLVFPQEVDGPAGSWRTDSWHMRTGLVPVLPPGWDEDPPALTGTIKRISSKVLPPHPRGRLPEIRNNIPEYLHISGFRGKRYSFPSHPLLQERPVIEVRKFHRPFGVWHKPQDPAIR